ncbi:MAG TPA: transcription antitermination factor NusB [Fervidobacterium sp.]|nr:transcription antitermination factor NusB [Fervidobacterium sp.]HOM73763.1 transcription antitermination factor NusB [Fervidobacterium sp.]HOQ40171.1 transcription antitermination factor NusB [Fervidobacterium sp.]HPT54689.1 transcription antitermination factor NusB [Fervidobacterium sp.]HPZ17977.1 transcription antitermination factor NusB [Fervidobacterium sp.]
MASRRRVLREAVTKVLFQVDFRPDDFQEILDEIVGRVTESNLKREIERYSKNIWQNRERIDKIISNHLLNWEFDRISYIERSILRLGTYELVYEQNIPIEVTLDEMIEIAKKYGAEESGRFVNGVLDKIAKTEVSKEKYEI